MKSAPFVSAQFLERLANPASRFYSDCLAFRKGEITRAEFVARLPHVAMLGDSVCMGFYISTPWATFWRSHTCRGRNWFVDADPAAGICSVTQRLEEITPLVIIEYAGVGALVDHQPERQNLCRRILGTRNFSGQVDQMLRSPRFPDLILICIGHNNIDWAWRCPPHEMDKPGHRLNCQRDELRRDYARELRRMLGHGRTQERRIAVVVFGLINFESYFKGREAAERLRRSDKSLFPHLETTYKYFVSFHPAYRGKLIQLAALVNEGLRETVQELNRELDDAGQIQLRYSEALARADLSRAELLHPIDGWHASIEGHNVLAEAAFGDLGPSVRFLGMQ